MELGKDVDDSVIEEMIKAQRPEQCALLVYTVSFCTIRWNRWGDRGEVVMTQRWDEVVVKQRWYEVLMTQRWDEVVVTQRWYEVVMTLDTGGMRW